TTLSGVGVGTYQLGPFFFGEEAIITVEHENDYLCNLQLGTFMTSGDCPVLIQCGTGPLQFSYCYANNETQVWNYSSVGGSGSLVMSFFSGTIETYFNDQFTIYDGTDNTGAILFQHNTNANFDLTGLVLVSTTGAIHMELTANGFNSCADNVTLPWSYQVECLNCVMPQASATNVDDCVNNQFSVPVDVTSLGDGSSVTLVYAVNGGIPVSLPGVGLGQTILGPFTINDVVSVFVQHELDAACTVALGLITDSGDCPNLITCGAQPLVENYCYTAGDSHHWSYQSVGSGTLRMTFHFGTIESVAYDHLQIYDGIDNTGTLLYTHTGPTTHLGPVGSATDLVTYTLYDGIQLYSVSGSFYMEMSSDGSVQCGSFGFDPWEWDVVCLDCSIPVADINIVDDCSANTYTIEVDVTSTGSGSTAALNYTENGGPEQVLSGLGLGITTLGPYAFGDTVNIILAHESNSLCNIPYGNFTNTGTCPLLIDCDGTLVNDSTCWSDNQDLRYYYQGTGTSPLRIRFNSSIFFFQDSIFVYDGGDINAPLLYADDGSNANLDVTDLYFDTTNPEHRMCFRIKSNAFTSCQTGFGSQQCEWIVGCLDCTNPEATISIVQDCENFQYSIAVDITTLGSDQNLEITNSAGLASTFATAAGTYTVGPFTSGAAVQISLINDASELCNVHFPVVVNPICPTILCGSSGLVQDY
ncbi:MAG TPA: hypothetical protein PK760_08200, partial [Flavobacteriales bacterium]|nr:hypothetical protein [Flavobacteriales bacterium]